jgi:glycosyltransferase involved in cell wall biosynthesis
VDVLFKALGQLDAQYHWTLTVAGDGAERDALTRLAHVLGIQDRVTFVGVVPPAKMPSLMEEHHAMVLPSRHEGRPNIILEAMAAGLPVIATDISGVRELVRKEITGFLVPPDDEVGLADALECAIRKPEELRRLGVAGRKRMIEEGLSWEATAGKYAAIYRELIKGGQG